MLARRLSDKIIAAHQTACEENHKVIANLLLEALEVDLSKIDGAGSDKREWSKEMESAFALHEKVFGSIKLEG
ncbi:MAG: hypothetical protein ISR45_09360 [Rhodospirillales bacterium]|nr:hypothetical protein [Rhodospirillales bacterium]